MENEKIIKDNSAEDLEAMEAFDMAVQVNPENDVWVCSVCGWEYDPMLGLPDQGIPAGTKFEDLPDTFTCPLCHAPKSKFEPKAEINPNNGADSWTNA